MIEKKPYNKRLGNQGSLGTLKTPWHRVLRIAVGTWSTYCELSCKAEATRLDRALKSGEQLAGCLFQGLSKQIKKQMQAARMPCPVA